MEHLSSEARWAVEEFGEAHLGNTLRTQRLVAMATTCALRPAGRITEAFCESAEREGAFRFVENEHVDPEAMMAAAHDAGAGRCRALAHVFVPVDKGSISVTDYEGTKSLGMVGTSTSRTRGLQVLSAVAVSPDGTPLGIVGQTYWKRTLQTRRSKKSRRRLPVEEKETQRWLDVLESAASRFAEHAPSTVPWFQIDREGDAWPILLWAAEAGRCEMTTRAHHDRRVCVEADASDPPCYLWPTVEASPSLGRYRVQVPGRRDQQERVATMEIRSAPVTLDMRNERTKKRMAAPVWAVWAREVGPPPGVPNLEWKLLTTHRADSHASACEVLQGYTQRWRIEDFHRVWKAGACNIEGSQLREGDHLERWAILLASVAIRILRLTHLARTMPDAPATQEFDRHEIAAVVALARPKGHRRGSPPTMQQMLHWVAKLGGYVGSSSGGPPGPTVLTRGLLYIRSAVALLASEEKT